MVLLSIQLIFVKELVGVHYLAIVISKHLFIVQCWFSYRLEFEVGVALNIRSLRHLICGVLAPWKLLPSPMEAVANPLPKHLLFGCWSSFVKRLPRP